MDTDSRRRILRVLRIEMHALRCREALYLTDLDFEDDSETRATCMQQLAVVRAKLREKLMALEEVRQC